MNEIHFYILIKVYNKNSFLYFLLFYYLWNLELFFVDPNILGIIFCIICLEMILNLLQYIIILVYK